jgi:hypothetical protein
MGSVDFPLFGGWHVTLFPGAFVIFGIALLAAVIVVLLIKKVIARNRTSIGPR